MILGASFDAPDVNHAFRGAQGFPFSLLSDVDRIAGKAYEVLRPAHHQYAKYPLRISYLIDPTGVIRAAYDVTDVGGHAAHVLADLEVLGRTEPGDTDADDGQPMAVPNAFPIP